MSLRSQEPRFSIPTFAGFVVNLTVVASATDILVLTGSATKQVRLKRLFLSGVQTTAGQVVFQLIKRDVADTSGTPAAITPVSLWTDELVSATATLASYTANPTIGGTSKVIWASRIPIPAAATAAAGQTVPVDFSMGNFGYPVTLGKSVNEQIALNLNGVTVTGGSITAGFEWCEYP